MLLNRLLMWRCDLQLDDRIDTPSRGLVNSIFRTILSQILNMNPLPSVNSAYSMVILKEPHSLIIRGRDERACALVFAACSNERSSMFCSVCAKIGNNASECFKIIGFPEQWGEQGNTSIGKNFNAESKLASAGIDEVGKWEVMVALELTL